MITIKGQSELISEAGIKMQLLLLYINTIDGSIFKLFIK